jgi:branched-chain amino acid transport system ATP-binding protein
MLELDRVTVSYGSVRALSEVSLLVPEGTVVALLGPNGAGKTTTLRAVSGLLRPDSGFITFAGRRIDGAPPEGIARLGVRYVPEHGGIFPSLTVEENLQMATYSERGKDPVGLAASMFPALALRLGQAAGTLSGGEQQMLALARAMVSGPRLLMLDEISMGLAPQVVSYLYASVRQMAEAGATLLLVEQYVDAALNLSDYVYVLDKGRVVDVGQPADVRGSGLLNAYLGVRR